jgi:hypothetical protein
MLPCLSSSNSTSSCSLASTTSASSLALSSSASYPTPSSPIGDGVPSEPAAPATAPAASCCDVDTDVVLPASELFGEAQMVVKVRCA